MAGEDTITSPAGLQAPDPGAAAAPGAAVVNGVGRPAGWEIARALARLGYAVHVTDTDAGVATRAAAELGAPAFGSALDARSLPACRAAASRTRRRLGSLAVWVNAPSVIGSAPAWELDERTRQSVLDITLVGTINGTLAALEVMRPEGSGAVINVVELTGLSPLAGQAVHSAAQHGVVAFSLGTLADLRATGLPGVNVSCLCLSQRVVQRASERLPAGLVELLERPRPLTAIPRWRGALVRARYLWPASGPFSPGGRSFARRPSRPAGR